MNFNNNCRCAENYCSDSGTLVAAGTASTQPCSGWDDETSLAASYARSIDLAAAYFPDQAYAQGYCPCEALGNGTLFPELVM